MRRAPNLVLLALLGLTPVAACDPDRGARDAGVSHDTGIDAGVLDAMGTALDAGALDAMGPPADARAIDGASEGIDAAGASDDAGDRPLEDASSITDARAPLDAAATDAPLTPDAFRAPDAHVGGACISGATGTHAVRFRWLGSGPGSTAYVRYEVNELPDTSRWRVTANSRSIGYRPVFDDTFLGEGGLDLEGTAFIDVELSLSGLSSLRGATLAIYGRSFNTTASGSFEWQTFDGTGAAPRGLVANSAPYEWYAADATTEFTAGDAGVLLRIYPSGPSGALIVAAVEICFEE